MFGRGKGTSRKNSFGGSMMKFTFGSNKNIARQEVDQNNRQTETKSNRGTNITLRSRRKKIKRKNSSSSKNEVYSKEGSSFLNLNPSLADFPTEMVDSQLTLKKTQSSKVLRFLSKTTRRKPKSNQLPMLIPKKEDFEFEIGNNKSHGEDDTVDVEEESLLVKSTKGRNKQKKTRIKEIDVEKQSTRKTSAGTAAESQVYLPSQPKNMQATPIHEEERLIKKIDGPRITTFSVYGEEGREELEITIKPKPKPKLRAPPPILGRGSIGNAAPKPPSSFELSELDY